MMDERTCNLLKETNEILEKNSKTFQDVRWVGTKDCIISKDTFIRLADVMYDDGFGSQKVARDLIIVGSNWWLERYEYDGSEGWEYKELPLMPSKLNLKVYALTVDQHNERYPDDDLCGWCDLEELNEIKEEVNNVG